MKIDVSKLRQELDKRESWKIQEKWGSLIQDKRKQKNWSLNELADGICSPSYLSRIENGLTTPSENLITRLLDKLWLNWTDDQINIWVLREITKGILYGIQIDESFNNLQYDDFNSLVVVIGYNVYNKNYADAIKAYNWLRSYIMFLSDEGRNYLLLFLSILSFKTHNYVNAFDIIELINLKDNEDDNLTYLQRIIRVKSGLLLNKIAIIHSDYPDIIDDLRNDGLIEQSDSLQKAFLLYFARYQSVDKIKKKLEKMETIDERSYDYILGKAYFYNKDYEEAIKIAAKYYQTDKDFWFLVLRTLNILDDTDSIKVLISHMHKFNLSKGKKFLVELYQNKHFQDDKRFLKFLRYNLLENEIFIEEYEILTEVTYEASDAFKKYFMYKESNQVSQTILPKLKNMVFYK